MIVFCRDTELLPQTSSRVTPAEKDGRKSEGQKSSGNRRVYELVTFFLIMHTYGYVNEVERFVREIKGVESVNCVKVDSNSNKLEVKGKVDPVKIRKMVKHKTKTKVTLISPSAESEGYGDKSDRPEEKLEKEKTKPDDIANKKIEESVTVLKIKLCCDSCNDKIPKILKDKGLEMVAIDKDKDLVTVKGIVNVRELKSVLKKDVEVVVPAKKDNVATKKIGSETGAIDKKGKDDGAVDKKGKEAAAAKMTMREEETERTVKISKGKGKGKDTKEVGATEVKGKHSEPQVRGGVEIKSNDKDSSVNQKKDKDGALRKNEESSNDGSRRRNNQEEGISVVNYFNADIFSDENPHSLCTIL